MPQRVLRDRLIELEIPSEDVARGRALRKTVPRRALAQLTPSNRSATEILVAQNAGRLSELVPLRFARMLTDPFSFYRGSAAVMAADLGASPSSAIEIMCCGDAHVSNFGMYAAPHRSIVFDLNDFDEAAVAPAEWDVKRLITSAIIGGRHAGYPDKAIRRCVEQALVGYQTSLEAMLEEMDVLERYYLRVEPERYTGKVSKGLLSEIQKTTSRARTRTSARVFKQIMEIGPDGTPRLREAPPVLQHVDEETEAPLVESIQEYLAAVPADVALLLSHFRVTDIALRVVGVGSVGTRCYLVILVGPNGTPLILQIKEAGRSVLDEYGGWPQPDTLYAAVEAKGQGARVIDGQQILQAMSDIFLGTTRKDGRRLLRSSVPRYEGHHRHRRHVVLHVRGIRRRVCGAAGAGALAERECVNSARVRRNQRHGASSCRRMVVRIRRQITRRLSSTARGGRGRRHRGSGRSGPITGRPPWSPANAQSVAPASCDTLLGCAAAGGVPVRCSHSRGRSRQVRRAYSSSV